MQLQPLEIRERRYHLQKEIESLDRESMKEQIAELEAGVRELQAICPHEHPEEAPDEGIWRCRDCDLRRELEGASDDAGQSGGEAAEADGGKQPLGDVEG